MNLKYSIRTLLLHLPGKNSFTQNKYLLCAALDISERTLDRWINTKREERFSIPSDHLFLIADFFKCTIEALLTQSTPQPAN